MQQLPKLILSIAAVAAAMLFAVAVTHCIIECHDDHESDGCRCFCHAGVYDAPAVGGLCIALSPQSFIGHSSETVDSIAASGIFRPPIA